MQLTYISIKNIPPQGTLLLFTEEDTAIWQPYILDTPITFSVLQAPQAKLFLQMLGDICKVQGEVYAKLSVPCSRCLKPTELIVKESIEEFIECSTDNDVLHTEGHYVCLAENKVDIAIHVANIVWDAILQATYSPTVCTPNCLGLCSICGVNKNTDPCHCEQQGDFRLLKLQEWKPRH